MITKNDCLLLLSELGDSGVDIASIYNVALNYNGVNLQVVKFINAHRQFEANKFYEKLRKSYNAKHSVLYKNIVRFDELTASDDILTTLASLNLQILLYSKNVSDKEFFLKQVRFPEICSVLMDYSNSYNLVPCIKLLHVIRADLKAFEFFSKETVK